MLGYYTVVAVTTAALLLWVHHQPHAAAADEAESPAPVTAQLTPTQATSPFPPAEIAKFRAIAADTLTKLNAGHQAAATARVADLEAAWDDDQPTLEPVHEQAWHVLDGEIDHVLKSLRAAIPNQTTETGALTTLLASLSQPG